MDPLGFGLENYDAIGRWRTEDRNFIIDSDGRLPGGRSFDGPEGLKQLLLADKNGFTKALAEKLLTYALGRGLEDYDQPAVQSIVSNTVSDGYKFSSLLTEIALSDPFRKRRGEAAPPLATASLRP
jgi:hypothetical protein